MNSQTIEQYKFYRLYDIDLDAALHTIKILKRYKRTDVRNALLRDITVAYTKPFSVNKGHKISKHNLSLKFVPAKLRALHKELMDLRKQLFAHTDLTFRNPKVANWSSGEYKWFPMSFKGFNYKSLNKRIDNIETLIRSVQDELRKTIIKIESTF